MKPFMVTQLQIAFERSLMMLSEFDETLHKQLVDYEVERVGNSGPVFSSKNDHFVDALGLAYLAFVLEFPELTDTVKKPETSNKVEITGVQLGQSGLNRQLADIETGYNPAFKQVLDYDPTDLPGDRPTWVKVSENYNSKSSRGSWGSRSTGMKRNTGGRSMW